MTVAILLALKGVVVVLVLAIGAGATFADLGWLWRRPRLMLRSLLAMYVLVPLAALVLVALLPLSPMARAALLVLMLISIAIGHALGGPEPDNRTALAVACATRHIGVALLVAAAFPGPRTAMLILSYVLCSLLVSLPYLRWRRRTAARAQAVGPR